MGRVDDGADWRGMKTGDGGGERGEEGQMGEKDMEVEEMRRRTQCLYLLCL